MSNNRILEKGVEIKNGSPEYVYNINWNDYVPLRYINEFTDYTHSSLRGLIHKGRVDLRAVFNLCNLILIRRDYIPALQMLYNHPDKHSRQKFMIDIYYNRVNLDGQKDKWSSDNLSLM